MRPQKLPIRMGQVADGGDSQPAQLGKGGAAYEKKVGNRKGPHLPGDFFREKGMGLSLIHI